MPQLTGFLRHFFRIPLRVPPLDLGEKICTYITPVGRRSIRRELFTSIHQHQYRQFINQQNGLPGSPLLFSF